MEKLDKENTYILDLDPQNQNYFNFDKNFTDNESNILVAIRVRPLNNKEISIGDFDVVRIEDKLIIILDPIEMEFETEKKKMLEVYHRSKEQQYAFDKIFREETQEEIYAQTCRHLIKPVISGYNATVFAYGPTGTGKTYTMLGNHEIHGLSALTIQDIFDYIKKDEEKDYNIMISYVEIYNESIRDLLVSSSSYLELRDDPIKGITISGVTEYPAESTEQVMNLLFTGNKRRTTEATNANLTSSRSHAVFQIIVNSKPKTKNTNIETLTSKLSLIDLAGSERGTVTENRGLRLREGAKINRSLLALANCINALGDKAKKGFFVPYRDSKLTRMLKDSLGGNCKTVMIANVSPASSQFEETINTLKYANRAKNIKTKVLANKKIVSIHIAEYKNIINDLRQEIDQLKSKLHDNYKPSGIEEIIEERKNRNLSECPCFCRRAEDEEQMKKIQAEIFENFQERIQLRRALMELEEQNALNILEIRRKQTEISIWNKDNNNKDIHKMDKKLLPIEIKSQFRQIQTLKASTDKNTLKREIMNLHLMENIAVAKKIRDNIPKRIKHQDKRDFLELVIKNHVLELQNIELEIHLQIQEKSIQDLKNIITNQKKYMNDVHSDKNLTEDNNLVLNVNNQDLENELDLEEIIYDEEFNEPNQEEDDDLDDINELANLKDFIEKSQTNQSVNQDLNLLNNPRKRDKSALDNQRISHDNANPRIRDKSAPKMLNKGMSEEFNNNCSIDIKIEEKDETIEEKKNNEKKKKIRKSNNQGSNSNNNNIFNPVFNNNVYKNNAPPSKNNIVKDSKEVLKLKEKNIIFPANLNNQVTQNNDKANIPKPKKK